MVNTELECINEWIQIKLMITKYNKDFLYGGIGNNQKM